MTFIIYDSNSGQIKSAYSVYLPADQIAAFLAANTPSGHEAIEVQDDSPALSDMGKWHVKNRQLQSV